MYAASGNGAFEKVSHQETISEEELIAGLLNGTAYEWPVEHVTAIETHVSRLFFAGGRVVKIKRPVDYGFVNHLTLEARKQSCLDEVRLNRLLSDDIYLDCAPITRDDGVIRLGGKSTPLEWATVMREVPADAMLDRRLQAGTAPSDLVDLLAARLIPFHIHASQAPGSSEDQAARAESTLRENLDEIARLDSPIVAKEEFKLVAIAMRNLLDTTPDAISERARAGWIREGHGDLKCEHVTLDPPGALQIYDCVEFSLAIRCADIASDLAFLLLDLERLGATSTSTELVSRYRSAGIDLPEEILRLYKAHRALVRVKVAALTAEHAAIQDSDAHADAANWLHRAFASITRQQPVLIAMTGFSGSGKSVVANAIATLLNATLISTDQVRKTRAINADTRYTPDQRLSNYQAMLSLAREAIPSGRSIVFDGAFLRDEERMLVSEFAREYNLPLVFAQVLADHDVVLERLAHRSTAPETAYASEATASVYQTQRLEASKRPPALPSGATRIDIDTTGNGPASLEAFIQQMLMLGIVTA